jgi:hypothetical protein
VANDAPGKGRSIITRPEQPMQRPAPADPFRSIGGHLAGAVRALDSAHAELRALKLAEGAVADPERVQLVRDLELLADVALDLRLQVESALLLGTAALGSSTA